MKIGIPIWGDKISPVMDTASRLLIVETDGQKVASCFETSLEVQELSRRSFRIEGLGVDILICGAISRPFLRRLSASGIHIIPGISGHPEDVLNAYLQGRLSQPRFLMPGYRSVDSDKTTALRVSKSPRTKGRKGERECTERKTDTPKDPMKLKKEEVKG